MPVHVTLQGSESLKRKLDSLGEVARGQMLRRALVAGALPVQNDAKRHAPYLTGNLRRSIHIGGHENLNPDGGDVQQRTGEPVPDPEVAATGVSVYVGTDVTYAVEQEFGTSRGAPVHPYLRPAADQNHGAVVQETAAALRDLIQAAIQ